METEFKVGDRVHDIELDVTGTVTRIHTKGNATVRVQLDNDYGVDRYYPDGRYFGTGATVLVKLIGEEKEEEQDDNI